MNNQCTKYTIQPGDTLSKIAKEHNTTVDAIARDNHISDPNKIRAGNTLFIHPETNVHQHLNITIVDAVSEPIKNLECKVTYGSQTISCLSDNHGKLPPIKTQSNEKVKVEVKKMTGGHKTVAEFLMGKRPKEVTIKSPKIRFDTHTLIDYAYNPRLAPKISDIFADNQLNTTAKSIMTVYNQKGAPVAKVVRRECSSAWAIQENLPLYQQKFFKDIASIICKKTKSTEIFAATAIAQAALESKWGKTAHLTLFGIKGTGATIVTHEVIDGKRIKIKDSFLAAKSIEEAVDQYINFLRKNRRYLKALKSKDSFTQIDELQKAGYATDPSYAKTVTKIIKTYKLNERYPND